MLAAALGLVHRAVGGAQELLDVAHALAADRDADAGRDPQRLARQVEARLERRQDALGGLDRVADVRALEQDPELVAAEPRDRVGGAHAGHEPLGHELQQLVAGRVPEPVVDGLEVVEVDEQHGHLGGAARTAAERVLGAVVEQRAVGEPGELVVEGAVAQLLLEALAGVVVAHGQDEPVDARVGDQVRGHGGDVPEGAVGIDHPPLGLRRFAVRLVGHGGQQDGDAAASSGCTRSSSRSPEPTLEGVGRAGHGPQPAAGVKDQDQVRRVLDDRLQPVAALLGQLLQRHRVLHPSTPLVREQRQQAGERQQRGG